MYIKYTFYSNKLIVNYVYKYTSFVVCLKV